MKSNSAEHDRRKEKLGEVLALVRAKVAPDQRNTLEAVVERYYGQVDPAGVSVTPALRYMP